MHLQTRFNLVCSLACLLSCSTLFVLDAQADDPEAVFQQRILPIFQSSDPSSCVQCHLSSVDLKDYILPDHKKTFLSLRDQGLVNLDAPEESKILKLIRMGEEDIDEGAKLIHSKMRKAEEDAFSAWIKSCCKDEELRNLPKLKESELAKPGVADGVVRHARKSRLVDSFARNVFSQRMRCFPCHTPHEIDPGNPRHAVAFKKQEEMKEKYGKQMARLDLFKETPEATLDFLIQSSREERKDSLPLLNLDDPKNSLLIQKPTSKLPAKKEDGTFVAPSNLAPVSHMGGLKMHLNDQSYKSFVAWIDDYAKTVGGNYRSVDELPADNWQPTQLILKLADAPEIWTVGTPVQMVLYRWDQKENQWSNAPIAFTQGTVTPRRLVNGALFLLINETASDESLKIPQEDLLVRIYVDKNGELETDPTLLLSESSLVGDIELNAKRWRDGFRFGKVVSMKDVRKE